MLSRLLGFEITATGFTALITVVSFLGGIHLIGIGVIGEYLGRAYTEVKRRPHYLISRKVGFEKIDSSLSLIKERLS